MDASELLALNEWLFVQEELDALLPLVTKSALMLSWGERGFVVLEREGRLDLDRAMASVFGGMSRSEVEHDARFALQAIDDMKTTIVSDPASGRSVLCAPFHVEQGSNGVIVLERARSLPPFDDAALRRAGKLAGQVGIAVRVTQRCEELRARCVQLTSRPPEPVEPLPVRPIEDLEREAILNALRATGNDKRRAAQLLGISRAKVYQRLKVWGLT